jgi:hypothetical protein
MTGYSGTAVVKPRRWDNANLVSKVLALYELGLVSDLNHLLVGDGSTPGGAGRLINLTNLHQAKHWFATVTGTNTLTFDLGAPYRPASYTTGHVIAFKPAANNTTAVTINVTGSGGTGLGAKDLQKLKNGALAALAANDLVAAVPTIAIYDGTRYVLTGGSGGGLWEHIDQDVISAQGTSDFQSIPSTSLVERFILDRVVPASAATLVGRVEVGGAWRETGGDYAYVGAGRDTSAGTTGNTAATTDVKIEFTGAAVSGTAGRGLSGIIELINPGAGEHARLQWRLTFLSGTDRAQSVGTAWFIGTTGAVTGLRFGFGAALGVNLSTGTITRMRLSAP